MRIIWNVPRFGQLLQPKARETNRFTLHYHGSITPERFPETIVRAAARFGSRVNLQIAGYEAPSARGYVSQLSATASSCGVDGLIDYAGQINHSDLLALAASADVGLALMPMRSEDINMRHMTGASNKPFEYMAAGLPILVSDLVDWREMFVAPGFAKACDPRSVDSISDVIAWFLEHPIHRQKMATRARIAIQSKWNYDAYFKSLLFEPLMLQI